MIAQVFLSYLFNSISEDDNFNASISTFDQDQFDPIQIIFNAIEDHVIQIVQDDQIPEANITRIIEHCKDYEFYFAIGQIVTSSINGISCILLIISLFISRKLMIPFLVSQILSGLYYFGVDIAITTGFLVLNTNVGVAIGAILFWILIVLSLPLIIAWIIVWKAYVYFDIYNFKKDETFVPYNSHVKNSFTTQDNSWNTSIESIWETPRQSLEQIQNEFSTSRSDYELDNENGGTLMAEMAEIHVQNGFSTKHDNSRNTSVESFWKTPGGQILGQNLEEYPPSRSNSESITENRGTVSKMVKLHAQNRCTAQYGNSWNNSIESPWETPRQSLENILQECSPTRSNSESNNENSGTLMPKMAELHVLNRCMSQDENLQSASRTQGFEQYLEECSSSRSTSDSSTENRVTLISKAEEIRNDHVLPNDLSENSYCFIVAGGKRANVYSSAVEVITGVLGPHKLPNLPEGIDSPSMVLHNGTILLCGGQNYTGNERKCLQLDYGSWNQHSNLNVERVGHSAVGTESASFVFGGTSSSTTYEYLPKDSTKWLLGKTEIPRGFSSGCAITTKSEQEIWLIGGDLDFHGKAILSFNINDHTFHEPPSQLNVERRSHRCAFIPNTNKIMITGGHNRSGYLDSTEILDTEDGSVTLASPMNFKRSSHGIGVIGIKGEDKLAVFGGFGGSNGRSTLDSVEFYNAQTEKWETTHISLKDLKRSFGFLQVKLGDVFSKWH